MGDCGGCNKRAVRWLKAKGYVEKDGWLIGFKHTVRVEDAQDHYKAVMLQAMKDKARAFVAKLKGET